MTYKELLNAGTDQLNISGIDNAGYDAFELLSFVTGMNKTDYLIYGMKQCSDDIKDKYYELIQIRSSHTPLQHITGKTCFYGYDFLVNENVLVPRFDTEILVEEAVKAANIIAEYAGNCADVLDMCTGSGCIILSLSKENVINTGLGADKSDKALEVARKNCSNLGTLNVDFVQSDLFSNINTGKKFDIIVSNPPYIRTDVIGTLQDEVRLHDPMIALDGGDDGLDFYRVITTESVKYIKKAGFLLYEIGHDQADEVSEIMRDAGYSEITVIKDLAGFDRVVKGRFW